jgi:hypothetical protein
MKPIENISERTAEYKLQKRGETAGGFGDDFLQ